MSISAPLLSIVSPVYLAEDIVDELVKRLVDSLSEITDNFEIILVEDSSPDNSWGSIERNCLLDKRVKGIQLSRNFGQHQAISAGLEKSLGEWIVVMDCDLQDRPEEIIKLYHKTNEGFDVVLASRINRNDTFYKKYSSIYYYKILSYLTGEEMDHTVANFGIYKRDVIKNVCNMRENIRFFPTMIKWVGFKQTKIEIEHSKRPVGESSYTLKKLLNLAFSIILASSEKPIKLIIKIGLIISLISFIISIKIFIDYLDGTITVLGYSSLFISICFFSGLILMTLGIVGLYIGKIFTEVKGRPLFIIRKELN